MHMGPLQDLPRMPISRESHQVMRTGWLGISLCLAKSCICLVRQGCRTYVSRTEVPGQRHQGNKKSELQKEITSKKYSQGAVAGPLKRQYQGFKSPNNVALPEIHF